MGPKNCTYKTDEIYTIFYFSACIQLFNNIKPIKTSKCHPFFMYIFELRLSIHILQKSWTKNHQYSQYSFELYQTVTNSSFYILLKLLNTWLSQFCAITNQLIFELAYMIGINLSLWLNLSHRKLLTTFALLFVNKNSFYFFFSSCDMEQSQVLVACHLVV